MIIFLYCVLIAALNFSTVLPELVFFLQCLEWVLYWRNCCYLILLGQEHTDLPYGYILKQRWCLQIRLSLHLLFWDIGDRGRRQGYLVYFQFSLYKLLIHDFQRCCFIWWPKKTVEHPYKRGCDYQMKHNKLNKHAITSLKRYVIGNRTCTRLSPSYEKFLNHDLDLKGFIPGKLWDYYRIYPKYSDTSTPYHTCSKIWTSTIHYPMLCLNIAGWVANS